METRGKIGVAVLVNIIRTNHLSVANISNMPANTRAILKKIRVVDVKVNLICVNLNINIILEKDFSLLYK